MAILDFEIYGYKRLSLREIKSVKLKPVNKLQMILGTNGSGKSSLLDELSAVVSKRDDFDKGGYKKITLQRKNNIFHCECDFRETKNRFLLKMNDEIQYEGHSSEAYSSKVAELIGDTAEIHSIRIGSKRFTTMDTDSRRKWFTKLSPQDYSYAIGYFKRLSEATRDISGAIKRVNTKLMQEKAKLIDEAAQLALKTEIQELVTQKQEMMQYWRPQTESFESIMAKIRDMDNSLDKQTDAVFRTFSEFCNAEAHKDTSELWNKLTQLKSKKAVLESDVARICENIEQNNNSIQQAKAAGVKDINQIYSELGVLSRHLLTISYDESLAQSPETTLTSYDTVYTPVTAILDELVSDPDLIYTREEFEVRKQKYEEYNLRLEGLNRTLSSLSEKKSILLHQKEQNHTECPKCKHAWSRGYNEDVFIDVSNRLNDVNGHINTLSKESNILKDYLEQAARQLSLIDRLGYLASGCKPLAPLWEQLILNNLVRINPGQALEEFKKFRARILDAIEYKKTKELRDDLLDAKELTEKTAGINQQELIAKNEALDSALYQRQKMIQDTDNHITNLKKSIDAMELQATYFKRTQDALMTRDQLIYQAEISNQHAAINEILMYLDNIIASKQRLLSQIDTQKSIIESLENEVKDYVVKESGMKAAMKSLSPSSGLIAKGLTGYINHFIAKMNIIIQKVWLYPLEICPVAMTDDELSLDYKFAFRVNDKPAGKDVSQGSGAQKEIFDLAFMIVSLIQLGMNDTEVFLDEFSIKMDYAHRKEAMKMVMDLLNGSDFSQIFMISHYESSYGSMSNADITVLCPENIQIPSDLLYNITSEISY